MKLHIKRKFSLPNKFHIFEVNKKEACMVWDQVSYRVNEKLIKAENLGNNYEYQSLKILKVARLRLPYQILVNKEKNRQVISGG